MDNWNKPCHAEFAFVRHSVSVDNEAWSLGLPWPGIADAPLCARGHEMLPEITAALSEWPPDLIVSSPLRRCIATARAIADGTSARFEIDYGLTEIPHNDGDLAPSPDALAKMYPDLVIHGESSVCYWDAAAKARSVRAMYELVNRPEKRICLVGHRCWLMTFAGLDIENGEIVCLDVAFAGGSAMDLDMTVTRISRIW